MAPSSWGPLAPLRHKGQHGPLSLLLILIRLLYSNTCIWEEFLLSQLILTVSLQVGWTEVVVSFIYKKSETQCGMTYTVDGV